MYTMISKVVNSLITPILLLTSIPFAILAVYTTTFAIAILALRLVAVYAELVLALFFSSLSSLLSPTPSSSSSSSRSNNDTNTHYTLPPPSPAQIHAMPVTVARTAPHPRPRRRTNTASSIHSGSSAESPTSTTTAVLVGSQTAIYTHGSFGTGPASAPLGINRRTQSVVSLPPSTPTPRDYEGVGGWQLLGDENGDEDEALWAGMNARLERAESPVLSVGRQRRRGSVSVRTAISSGAGSPELRAGRRGGGVRDAEGGSPEGYFGRNSGDRGVRSADASRGASRRSSFTWAKAKVRGE